MHHFAYREGVLHAEDVDLRRLADEVGTPFYCYSSATLERHYRVFAEAFADTDALVCYAMKANSNQAVLKTLGRLGRRHGHRLGRRTAPGAGRRRPGRAHRVFRGRQDEGRDGLRPRQPASCASTWNPSRSSRPCPRWRFSKGMRAPVSIRINPDVDAKTHKKISTGKSENKFGIPIAPRPRGLCPGGPDEGHRDHGRRHAYRQPDHGSRALRQCHRAAGGAGPRPHGRRPQAPPHRSRRRSRHALSRGQRAARPIRRPMRGSSSATPAISASSSSSRWAA